jgi:hypothetical protein
MHMHMPTSHTSLTHTCDVSAEPHSHPHSHSHPKCDENHVTPSTTRVLAPPPPPPRNPHGEARARAGALRLARRVRTPGEKGRGAHPIHFHNKSPAL